MKVIQGYCGEDLLKQPQGHSRSRQGYWLLHSENLDKIQSQKNFLKNIDILSIRQPKLNLVFYSHKWRYLNKTNLRSRLSIERTSWRQRLIPNWSDPNILIGGEIHDNNNIWTSFKLEKENYVNINKLYWILVSVLYNRWWNVDEVIHAWFYVQNLLNIHYNFSKKSQLTCWYHSLNMQSIRNGTHVYKYEMY